MIHFKNSVVIDCPVGEVFAFISDFENMPKWNYFVIEVRKVSPGPIGIDTIYDQQRKTDRQRYRITEYEPNQRVTVRTIPPAPALGMRFTFSAAGKITHLEDEWQLETGYPGFLERLAAWRVKSAVKQNLLKLKQLLEQGEVYLQDGRHVTIQ